MVAVVVVDDTTDVVVVATVEAELVAAACDEVLIEGAEDVETACGELVCPELVEEVAVVVVGLDIASAPVVNVLSKEFAMLPASSSAITR